MLRVCEWLEFLARTKCNTQHNFAYREMSYVGDSSEASGAEAGQLHVGYINGDAGYVTKATQILMNDLSVVFFDEPSAAPGIIPQEGKPVNSYCNRPIVRNIVT